MKLSELEKPGKMGADYREGRPENTELFLAPRTKRGVESFCQTGYSAGRSRETERRESRVKSEKTSRQTAFEEVAEKQGNEGQQSQELVSSVGKVQRAQVSRQASLPGTGKQR